MKTLELLASETIRLEAIFRKTLETIANEPCDHGPGFCPRLTARKALALPITPDHADAPRLAEENERLWQALNVLYIESLHFADNRIGEQCLRDAIKAAHDILMKSNKEHNAALAREEINR